MPPWRGSLGAALRRAAAGYRRQVDDELIGLGFPARRPSEGRVLLMCTVPGQTISDVARRLRITRQGAGKIVAELRERGYLDVLPSSVDGREKILTPTARGNAYLNAYLQVDRAIQERLRATFGDDLMRDLRRVLEVISGEDDGIESE